MKTTTIACSVIATLLLTATTALAAGTREDNSGIFVWVFLGFCALIIAAQLVPALLVLLGIVKGVTEPVKQTEQSNHAVRK